MLFNQEIKLIVSILQIYYSYLGRRHFFFSKHLVFRIRPVHDYVLIIPWLRNIKIIWYFSFKIALKII